MFRRVDWNGDGRITLDEYAASERNYFASLDRQGTGAIACGGSTSQAQNNGSRPYRARGQGRHGQFCTDNDLNKDGTVTRAEFDKAVQQRFTAAAKGGKTLNSDQFYQIALARFQQSSARYFQRLDTNHDGKLTLAEYAAPSMSTFARADKNNDGAITQDEIGRHSNWRRAQANRKPGQRPG
jgi:Ca2+-binding EF-hand superfamily protein